MKLIFKDGDDGTEVYLDDELIWMDSWCHECPEDLIWDRIVQQVFEAGQKLGRAEARRQYEYPRDAIDI